MKLNKVKWLHQRVYSWTVADACLKHRIYTTKYLYRSTATNIGELQILNKIFHDYSFEDFFIIRKFCMNNKDYEFSYEKNIDI